MNHDQARHLLLDLAYGELDAATRAEVEGHVAACPGCRAELDEMVATRAVASRLAEPPAPSAPGRARLVEAARRAVAPPARPRALRAALPWATAAAAIALVGGLTFRLVADRPGPGLEELASPPARRAPSAPAAPRPAPPAPGSAELAGTGEARSRAETAPLPPSPASPPTVSSAPPPPAEASRRGSDAFAGAAASKGAAAPAAGGLREERRELTCRGERVVRVALVAPGGWIARLTVREGDAPPREGWYDETGRLRGSRTLAPAGKASREPGLPEHAPTLEELGNSCAW
jgi:hypothetical protein